MPKDEFDFEDPMELNGVAFVTQEDTTEAMCECFVEEFMRMGYDAKQVLSLFRNPHYLGMNMVLEQRGEGFIRDRIAEVFAHWGRPVAWTEAGPESAGAPELPATSVSAGDASSEQSALTDPMGAPLPSIKL